MRKKTATPTDKQRKYVAKTNPLVKAQTRKMLLKHYRAKYRVK